jgi:hypothetical protein
MGRIEDCVTHGGAVIFVQASRHLGRGMERAGHCIFPRHGGLSKDPLKNALRIFEDLRCRAETAKGVARRFANTGRHAYRADIRRHNPRCSNRQSPTVSVDRRKACLCRQDSTHTYSGTIKCTNAVSATAVATSATCSIGGLPVGLTVGVCSAAPPATVAPSAP